MLDGWHEFYALLGTAATTLVALLFVAASIGVGYLSGDRAGPTRTFTSPVLFHYTYVLFASLAALVPVNTETSLAAIIGITALAGLAYTIFILVRVMRSSAADIADRFGYGASPLAAYAAALAVSGIHLPGLHDRPSASGQRAGSAAADQYPQRLGFDPHLRAPAHRRPAATI
jgi:hypothetical protein